MNNIYHDIGCPAIYLKQIYLTNYLPKRTFDQYIRKNNKITTNEEYRTFLQKNGSIILDKERERLISLNTCNVGTRQCDICSDNRYID
jgi:hypothetical protein